MIALALPRAESPEQVGLSSLQLETGAAVIRRDVDEGLIPGAVLAVARAGRLAYCEAFGFRDREAGAAMTENAIFRIASMTKPITSVAAMMLAEEGRLDIAAPVAAYLPEFTAPTVGVERRPAQRTMTVLDLLRHTSGLTYARGGDSPVQMLWREIKLMDWDQTNAELVSKLAGLPLMFEPGTTWEYGMSADVLGRVVEVVSGRSLAEVFANRIAGPLGMADTGFVVPAERAGRFVEPHAEAETGELPKMPSAGELGKFQSGGGGAVSTAGDYLRFCQMLLNGGELDDVRLLQPETVARMTAQQLPADVSYGVTTRRGGTMTLAEMGCGFGLGFAVRIVPGRPRVAGSVGEYFWGGGTGTYFWIDPPEELIAVLMMTAPRQGRRYGTLARRLVYAALDRPAARHRSAGGAPARWLPRGRPWQRRF